MPHIDTIPTFLKKYNFRFTQIKSKHSDNKQEKENKDKKVIVRMVYKN